MKHWKTMSRGFFNNIVIYVPMFVSTIYNNSLIVFICVQKNVGLINLYSYIKNLRFADCT